MAWVKGDRLAVNLIHAIEVEDRSDAQTGPLVQVKMDDGRVHRYAGEAATAILRHVGSQATLTAVQDDETKLWLEEYGQEQAAPELTEAREPRPIR